MATLQKILFVNFGLRKAGFSDDTMLTPPTPQQIQDALEDLDLYMREFHNNVKETPYIFADDLDLIDGSDDSGLDEKYLSAIGYQLAIRIIDDAQRDVPNGVATRAGAAMRALKTAIWEPTDLKRRNDMPTGEGNKTWNPAGRFYYDGSDK